MKIFIVAILLAFVRAEVIKRQPKCVTIHSTTYEQEVLKTDVSGPYQLAIDYATNTLFFSYSVNTNEVFSMAYLNLKTKDYGLISGIQRGSASAVDNTHHKVYLGGKEGLYEFNYNTKAASKVDIGQNLNIWQMFYKDKLYFSTYPDEQAYFYQQGKVEHVNVLKDRAMLLAVKNDGNFVYSNSSGLFIYDRAAGKANLIGDYTVNGFTADINGKIYFSTPSGIYLINDKANEVEKLAVFEDVFGIAIEENGNIIYANENSILRLKPTERECLNVIAVKSTP